MEYYAGIDLGGTKIYTVVINPDGQILGRTKIKIGEDRGFDVVFGKMMECYQMACTEAGIADAQMTAIGLAVPSPVDLERGVIKHAPNLGWKEIEIRSVLQQKLNKPLFVGNDVNMGVFDEYHLGAGKGFSRVYGLFIGTGIGGGYVVDGQVVRGVNYTAGEAGHIIIKMGGPQCNCGLQGCLEAIAAKAGMIKYMIEQVDKKRKKTLLDQIAPNWRQTVGSSALSKALKKNDKVVKKALKRSAKAIGVAAANLITATGVEAIIIGGGVIEEMGDFFMPRIEKSMRANTFDNGSVGVELRQAALGDDAVALGTAWYVRMPENQYLLYT
ncbi:ROK family protein [Candidatus Vecturithrix granuli]|uniref:ROK family protein n=1 Tax=Vecturithrix granuli TaxID=1499967 RepID=A0A081C1M9_VECG1|nr:ROK family protein [Candidatus Vecturithrix granuli]